MSKDHTVGLRTIALIDDSLLLHQIVRQVLEPSYRMLSFMSGEEALANLQQDIPDLILLDVEMTGMNGFDVIQHIREISELESVPVIFLTAKSDVSFELKALNMGATDYICKPFTGKLLEKRIEIHLTHADHKRMLMNDNQGLQHTVQTQLKTIKELQHALIFTLANLVEIRDNFTGKHVLRTQEYYRLLLDILIKNKRFRDELIGIDFQMAQEASQLHDIGKIAISDLILLKPENLSPEEFEIMKTHTTIGYDTIVKAMRFTSDKSFLQYAATIAIAHHEKWDGTGYPNHLAGNEIPLLGRIMAIVDVYDALTSERPYKKGASHEDVVQILMEESGKAFDPNIVLAFLDSEKEFKKIQSR